MSLFYAVYLSHHNIPRKKYPNLSSAVIDAGIMAEKKNTPSFVIEFAGQPCLICRCDPDGSMEQM